MKCKALFGLRLLLGLVLLAIGNGQSGGLDIVVQHIQTVGARQWLGLMAGSIASQTPVIARALPGRSAPFSYGEVAERSSA
jgi:hypothetical protein